MLKQRVVTACCCLPLVIVAVWFDQPLRWLAVFLSVYGALAVYEFYLLTGVARVWPLAILGMAWTVLFILSPYTGYGLSLPFLLVSALLFSLVLLVLLPQKEGIFGHWAWTMGGILYVGLLLSYLVLLRLDAGRNWVLLTAFATFGSDSAAYFLGRAFGRHRLAPRISPGKTWEGAVAGVFGAVIVCILFTLSSPLNLPLSAAQAILLGLLVGVFGQFGDLAESLLKRHTGVKESGGWMPGHGGLLDRMDSVAFAGVVVYYFFLAIS